MKFATRQYYCPTCGHEEKHGTNHIGEIYCDCRACGNSPLYCVESDMQTRPAEATATLHAYRFNLETDREAYLAFCQRMTEEFHYTKFNVLDHGYCRPAGFKHLFSMAAWTPHDGETVKLFNLGQFERQYVSNLGRVHDWYETIYPNRKIREGYWLEKTLKEVIECATS